MRLLKKEMRMRKLIFFAMAILLFSGCGVKYKTECELLVRANRVMSTLIKSLDEYEGENAAAELERFLADFGALQPELRVMLLKHPEWKSTPPEKLKEPMEEFDRNFKALEDKLMWYTAGLAKSDLTYRIVEGVRDSEKLLRNL